MVSPVKGKRNQCSWLMAEMAEILNIKLLEWRDIQRKNSICGLLSSPWLWPNTNLTEPKSMVENTTERLKLSRNDRGCKMVALFGVLKRVHLIFRLKLIWRSSKDNTDVGISRQEIEAVIINIHEKFKKKLNINYWTYKES